MAGTGEAREVLSQLATDYELLAESVALLERSRKTLSQPSLALRDTNDPPIQKSH